MRSFPVVCLIISFAILYLPSHSAAETTSISLIPSLFDFCKSHDCKQSSSIYSISDELNKHVKLFHGSIVDLEVDVIVNAANSQLRSGGGICGQLI